MQVRDIIFITVVGVLAILFFISYSYGWNYQDNLPKKIFENDTAIKLHIDDADDAEYFHRRYGHDYPESIFDEYLYEGKGYLIIEMTSSSGCFSDANFLERCDYFILLEKSEIPALTRKSSEVKQ